MEISLKRWTYFNALAVLIAIAFVVAMPSAAILVPIVGFVSLAAIWLRQDSLRIPDVITAVRAAGGVAAFFLSQFGSYGSYIYISVLVLAEVMDFFDGFLARKMGGSEFGGVWDMETDAYFILLLSISAWKFGDFGLWAIVPGLFRYVFLFLFAIVRPVPIRLKTLSWFMKTVCVVAVICLIGANASFFSREIRGAALVLATLSLGVSFLWESMYYLTHRENKR